jgi:hypothetical protein
MMVNVDVLNCILLQSVPAMPICKLAHEALRYVFPTYGNVKLTGVRIGVLIEPTQAVNQPTNPSCLSRR